MPEIHLKQSKFTYSACGPFTKNKKRIQKLKETEETSHIYKNELDKACFQHDMSYGDFKDLEKRTASHKVLKNKTFSIAKNPNLLSVIDIFSKFVSVAPLKDKEGISVINPFQKFLKESSRKPRKI